jgi:hypothetical protein
MRKFYPEIRFLKQLFVPYFVFIQNNICVYMVAASGRFDTSGI